MTHNTGHVNQTDNQAPGVLLLGLATLVLALLAAWPATFDLGHNWIFNEAYSHGFVLVAAAAYLGWLNASASSEASQPSWLYLPVGLGSLFIILIAHLSELHVVAHYGYFGFLVALVLAVSGIGGLRRQFIPLCLVLLAIPIPGYVQFALTSDLKLISSQLGGALLQLLNVPVYIQGNIIDLGSYRLHVADACSGLNYLVPLLAIGVMLAGFLKTTPWRRIAIVVLTIPLTIAMNVVRIAVAGLMVRHIGPETAEGFIHDFEGWMVFVATLVLLLPLTAVLLRIGPAPTTLTRAFVVDLSATGWPIIANGARAIRNLSLLMVLTIVMVVSSQGLKARDKFVPERVSFDAFPLLIGDWIGTSGLLDDQSLDILRLTDYAFVSYRSGVSTESLELLATWYAEQTDGATPHSPEICLPGAGWEIAELDRISLPMAGETISLNRAVLERRGERMLAYYWFQQRGRIFANEFAMKWFIVQDAVLENRVDGGMVRLTTKLDGSAADGDARLQGFMTEIWPILPRFLPD